MKYMGSKRAMLQNGLGHLLEREAASASRFVDLFAGSGAVASFVARRFAIPVLAVDLQQYSVILTEAVIGRESPLDTEAIWKNWHRNALALYERTDAPPVEKLTRATVDSCRAWCARQKGAITQAYGGHYFSPEQATWIDAFRTTAPARGPNKAAAIAALIHAASKSAAAPGHTAQPFQPSRTAKRFLEDAWTRSIVDKTRQALTAIAQDFALKRGHAEISDANTTAMTLRSRDLVFIDPPYSGVHYSRFYHVLETIALGNCGEVSGVGRYPASKYRPRSKYSLKRESTEAFRRLMSSVSSAGATAVVTFPNHSCSNGLSGTLVRELAHEYFQVEEQHVKSKFSTLGGTKAAGSLYGRAARHDADELILVLRP